MSNPDSPPNHLPERAPEPPALPAAPSANPFREDVEIFEAEMLPSAPGTAGESPFRVTPLFRPPAEPTFHVPTRFGMSAILGTCRVAGGKLRLTRTFGETGVMSLYFGLLSMVICIVQMRFGDVPRQASIIAGAVMLPVFLIGVAMFMDGQHRGEFACLVVFSIPIGGFLGYVTGTFAGGIFLLMDMFEKYWTGKTWTGRAADSRLDGVSGPR